MLETAKREPGPYVVGHGYGRRYCETKERGRLNGAWHLGTNRGVEVAQCQQRSCRGGVAAPS